MANCLISWDAVSWSMDYRADYRFNATSSVITKVRALHYGGAGSLSNGRLEIVTPRGTKTVKSHARGSVDQSTPAFTRTVGIDLKVSTSGGKTSSFG
jgi:hypothetical protein